jgi:hypothetical protein
MKTTSQGRKQRRLYERYLKETDMNQYKIWKSGVLSRGLKTHEENAEEVRKSEEVFYEGLQTKSIRTMKNAGMENDEIDSIIEKWVQTIRLWGSKEPKINRRKLNLAI